MKRISKWNLHLKKKPTKIQVNCKKAQISPPPAKKKKKSDYYTLLGRPRHVSLESEALTGDG